MTNDDKYKVTTQVDWEWSSMSSPRLKVTCTVECEHKDGDTTRQLSWVFERREHLPPILAMRQVYRKPSKLPGYSAARKLAREAILDAEAGASHVSLVERLRAVRAVCVQDIDEITADLSTGRYAWFAPGRLQHLSQQLEKIEAQIQALGWVESVLP